MFGFTQAIDAAPSKAEEEVAIAFEKYFDARANQNWDTVAAMESATGTYNSNSDGSFHKALSKKGWMGYNWPVEYGGTGWSASKLYIFNKELGLAGCPPILPFGVGMVGPVIYTFGNDEQKERFLPDILNFNTWWCQGYSEPGSGSDLASLKTKAVLRNDLDEDYYVVNGSKTWTTSVSYTHLRAHET